MTDRQDHWNTVYSSKSDDSVSWFEETPSLSARLIADATQARGSAIDIGGGASRLPEALLEMGFADVASLDLSAEALRIAQERLGPRAARVRPIVADITHWTPDRLYDVWHDRAAFHFLTDPADQALYAKALQGALVSGGIAVIGTFALDGPERCSGLSIVRYDSHSLLEAIGEGMTLLSEAQHEHRTPAGNIQRFQFTTLRKA